MSIISKLVKQASKFVAKELTVAACAEVGRHVGDAVGNLLGKRIDSTHGQTLKGDDTNESATKASPSETLRTPG